MFQQNAKKICLVGDNAVGKTSLVQRFVRAIYSADYTKTVGVKIETKEMGVIHDRLKLIIWDIDGGRKLDPCANYTRGASGFIFVVDGPRADTLDSAIVYRDFLIDKFPHKSYACLINKVDLRDQWALDTGRLKLLCDSAQASFETSAKTGTNVDVGFNVFAKLVANNV